MRFNFIFARREARMAALCLLAGSTAHAARPMITDDARLTDAGACQLETWLRHASGSSEDWVMPACNPSGNLEISVGGAGNGGAWTDQVLQATTLLEPVAGHGWGLGLSVGVDRHPGAGRDWFANLPATLALNDGRSVVHANIGWQRAQGASGMVTAGLGAERQLTARSWLIAETFRQARGKPQQQVGLRHWLAANRVQADLTYGRRNDGPHWISLGLRVLP